MTTRSPSRLRFLDERDELRQGPPGRGRRYPAMQCELQLGALTVATPILPTTMPAPRFASAAACAAEAGAQAGREQRDNGVARAGDVENLARLRGQSERLLSSRNSVIPCSPRVTSSARQVRVSAAASCPSAQRSASSVQRADHGFELAAIRRERRALHGNCAKSVPFGSIEHAHACHVHAATARSRVPSVPFA